MKKITWIFFLILLSSNIFGQQPEPMQKVTKDQYLIKSKNQKTTAWILLGTGSAMMIVGGIEWRKNFNLFTNGGDAEAVIAIAGLPVAAASIPFFISAARNKGRAEVSVTNTKAYRMQGNKGSVVYMPSIKLSVEL